MAYNTLVYRLKDEETDTKEASVPVYVPTGKTLAQYQGFSDFFAPLVDNVSGSQITGAFITLNLTLPGGLKATPADGALNERGGLITFDTTGPRADSFRIPAILDSIMSGDAFSLEDTDIAALIAALMTEHGASTIEPRTSQDYLFSAARKGSKSFRK